MKNKDINIAILSEVAIESFENLKRKHVVLRKEYPTLDCQQFKYENYVSILKVHIKNGKIAIIFEVNYNERFKNEFYRMTQKNFFRWASTDLARKIERQYGVETYITNDDNHEAMLDIAGKMDNFKQPIVIHRIKINQNKKITVL